MAYEDTEDYKNLIKAQERETKEAEEPKKMSFKDAFAAARKGGDKTFMFNGKKYTTEMAGEKKTAPAKAEAKPASMTGKEVADEKRRLEGRAGKSRLGESAFGRLLQRGMNRDSSSSSSSGSMDEVVGAKKGGMIKKYAMGGSVGSASKRADGCATKGKTRGKMV